MRKESSTILYFFLALIIFAGLSLFIYKDKLSGQLLSSNGDETAIVSRPSASDIKLDILRDSRIKDLKNNVSIFDYANLDKSQDAIEASRKTSGDVIISNPGETASSTENNVNPKNNFIRVRVGNSNPFIVNKVVK